MTPVKTRKLIAHVAFAAAFSSVALPAAAGVIAASTGKLDIVTTTLVAALNSPLNGGVYVQADGVDGAKTDVETSDPNFKIKGVGIVKQTNPLQNMPFGWPGWGLVPVLKFPGGNPTCGFIQTEKIGPNTDSFAASNFCTDIDNTKVKTKYTADFNPKAEVKATGAKASDGKAVANGSDPWVFESDFATELDLTVMLDDVSLQAISDINTFAMAGIETFGSFGFLDNEGLIHILESWSYSDSVLGDAIKGPYSVTLLDKSFELEPGVDYVLDASITVAAALVPEPSSMILFLTGMLMMGYGAARAGITARPRAWGGTRISHSREKRRQSLGT